MSSTLDDVPQLVKAPEPAVSVAPAAVTEKKKKKKVVVHDPNDNGSIIPPEVRFVEEEADPFDAEAAAALNPASFMKAFTESKKKEASAREERAELEKAKNAVDDRLDLKRLELKKQKMEMEERELNRKRIKEMEDKAERNLRRAAANKAFADNAVRQSVDEEENTPENRASVYRKIVRMQTELGCPMTNTITPNTPLSKMKGELELMNQAMNQKRAEEMPQEVFLWAVGVAEQALDPVWSIKGIKEDVQEVLSPEAQDRESMQFKEAMTHVSIMYGDWFSVGPKLYIGMRLLKMVEDRHKANVARMAESGTAQTTDDFFNAYQSRFGSTPDADAVEAEL